MSRRLELGLVALVLFSAAVARAEAPEPIVGRLWLRPPLGGVVVAHPSTGDDVGVDLVALTGGVESGPFVAEAGGGVVFGSRGDGPELWIRGGFSLQADAHWQFPVLIGYRFTSRGVDAGGRENLGSIALDLGPQLTFGSGTRPRVAMRLLCGVAVPFARDAASPHTTLLLDAALEIGLSSEVH